MHDMHNEKSGCCGEQREPSTGMNDWHERKKAKLICMCLALLALTAWLGFKARNEARQYNFIGVPIERNVITVSGEGKVIGIPDVAGVDLGTTIEKSTVAEAQKENTRIMNQLVEQLKGANVDKNDIQTTAYNVYPNYNWNDGKQTLRSYTVAQTVHVKIRNLDKVGDILGKAGALGTNQIGGIQFTVDDPEKLKEEARAKALKNAKEKAKALATVADVKLRRVISFDESQGGTMPPPIFYGKGGMGSMAADAAPAPSIAPGSNEIIVTVNLTYEIE